MPPKSKFPTTSSGKNAKPAASNSREDRRSQSYKAKETKKQVKQFTAEDIDRITKKRSQKIGKGELARVYAGELDDETKVAVKIYQDKHNLGEHSLIWSSART